MWSAEIVKNVMHLVVVVVMMSELGRRYRSVLDVLAACIAMQVRSEGWRGDSFGSKVAAG